MSQLNRDVMNMIPVKAAANVTMSVIDHLQNFPPEYQVVALVASFKLMTERFEVDPQDAFTLVDNIMNHAQGRRAEFEAVRMYLQNEV